jgi:uncharacterized protein (DUF1697 family)
MNARSTDLKRAFEAAGFTGVVTVLASGNVVFDARAQPSAALEKKAEAAMRKVLGSAFLTFVRPVATLEAMIASDPYRGLRVDANAKRIVTFVRTPPAVKLALPIERDNARLLRFEDGVLYSAYLPTPKGPVFMVLIEKAFGKEQTTRTWQTVGRVARA